MSRQKLRSPLLLLQGAVIAFSCSACASLVRCSILNLQRFAGIFHGCQKIFLEAEADSMTLGFFRHRSMISDLVI